MLHGGVQVMADTLRSVIAENRAHGRAAIPSVCSAHPDVLRASLRLAAELNRPVVIEATSNQVNQDGGYTGLRPADFVALVQDMAKAVGCPQDRVIFGGDHLGPQAWRKGDAANAMAKARVMVADYVQAGFTKIHLDCSEGCAGESAQVGDAIAAARAADLAKAALAAASTPAALLFVVGTEVPPPGGARAGDDHDTITPTAPAAALATIEAHLAAFEAAGIKAASAQISGLVVQPGVEFSATTVHHLPLARDPGFGPVLARFAGLCLEAHSTDYQYPQAFARLAELGFAFQKVGPALTHAFRRALYGLEALRQMAGSTAQPVWAVMEDIMLQTPQYWIGHYQGTATQLRSLRHFSLADRIRYCWPHPLAQAAVASLLADIETLALPDHVLTQTFAPDTIAKARLMGGSLSAGLICAEIQSALRPYFIDSPAPIGEEPAP
jgi:D-tagatose-1,6-bisphosphate aldolase subunit GatZ/KbaZ